MSFDHFDEICKLLPLLIDVYSLKTPTHVEDELNNWCDFFHNFMLARMMSKKPSVTKMPTYFMEASQMVNRGILSDDEDKFLMLEPVWDRLIKNSKEIYGNDANKDVIFYKHCFVHFLSDVVEK